MGVLVPRCCFWFCFWFCFCGLLRLSSSDDVNCTVDKDGKQTTYNISGVSLTSDGNASDYEYSWVNGSDHVLANNHDRLPGLVLRNSINTLVISECIDKVSLERTHKLQGTMSKVVCETNCTHVTPQDPKEIYPYWIVVAAAVFLLLLLLLLLVFLVLRYIYRDKILRMCKCDQMRCLYTVVKEQFAAPADVEANE